ncbi:MAG: LysM peptidoglycan-binding domain-containing protein [Cardiobacteriaceae bacterium]|nr:LysM peptidoglycan-binding domain-containing protein [Cardiobacteriaceae bacterium]
MNKNQTSVLNQELQELNNIAADTVGKFISSQIQNCQISAELIANERKIILRGFVTDNAAIQSASDIAANIKGIAQIENLLAIKAPQEIETEQNHIVKNGETLSDIAKEYYGNPQEIEKIISANPELFTDIEAKLFIGQKIRIPA